ncbi:hypothetical protein AV530_000597 [Patagioenas fasciata monilis]|uniref:Uncharacterized protein n=1 Tax=Patagioenas fasciata monilis TaxID=372326 RepID=A0A1V4IFT0_PATFA|nr:hypothetical protein AV530_000597 [Patagioenas fasciata monilis]
MLEPTEGKLPECKKYQEKEKHSMIVKTQRSDSFSAAFPVEIPAASPSIQVATLEQILWPCFLSLGVAPARCLRGDGH